VGALEYFNKPVLLSSGLGFASYIRAVVLSDLISSVSEGSYFQILILENRHELKRGAETIPGRKSCQEILQN
jgi:hypothetical protein